MKKISALIFDSTSDKDQFLNNIFTEMEARGLAFCYYFSRTKKRFHVHDGLTRKACLGPATDKWHRRAVFLAMLPFLRAFYLFRFLFVKIKRKPKTVIMVGWNEKLILSPAVRLLGLRPVWIEKPTADYRQKGFWGRRLYKMNSKKAAIVAFNSLTRENLLEIGVPEENIRVIHPGVKLKKAPAQGKLPLPANETVASKFKKNFFAVGTVTDLDTSQGIEPIFKAIKICSEFIPNIQLIVVGDGTERKNLAWTAKKMGIETLVWLVGEHGHTRKWLDSFDVFVVTSETLGMADLDIVLKCMMAGLPILTESRKGLENIVVEGETGIFLKDRDSETLASAIIKLYQEKNLRLKLGKAGKSRAENFFNLNSKADEFQKIIDL